MQVYKDVVQKYCHAIIQYIIKRLVHSLHECGRCIHEPNGQYNPFVKTAPH